ncbi:MAG: PP2C family protein-serine/threonine phosphatase [Pirellulaceae bacterium]
MAFKIVLIAAAAAQFAAAGLALRLNYKYRGNSAWILISAAAILMAIRRGATLVTVWQLNPDVFSNTSLWTECTASLLVSVLFMAGVGLIEPHFIELSRARDVLRREKKQLERVVQQNEDELRIARQVQQNLFPSQPPQLPGLDIWGASHPAEWAGGDYFDYLPLDDGSVVLVIADVSGHGIGPALLMSETRVLLRSLATQYKAPEELLNHANRFLVDDVESGRFVTMFLARVCPRRRLLTYAGAGHNAYLMTTAGALETLHASCPPLGAVDVLHASSSPPVQLQAGELLLLATDGVLETQNPQQVQFGERQLLRVLSADNGQSAQQVGEQLLTAARRFAEGAPQDDDNTVVVLKVLTAEPADS